MSRRGEIFCQVAASGGCVRGRIVRIEGAHNCSVTCEPFRSSWPARNLEPVMVEARRRSWFGFRHLTRWIEQGAGMLPVPPTQSHQMGRQSQESENARGMLPTGLGKSLR